MPRREPLQRARPIKHNPDASNILHFAARDVNYLMGFVNELIERVNLLEAELEPLREAKRKA